MTQLKMPAWMPVWKQMRWHLLLLVLGLAFISTYLWLESRHLSSGNTAAMQGLPPSSSIPVNPRGSMGSARPTPIDSGHSMVERGMVMPDSDVVGDARERFASGELQGIPDPHPVKAVGYPVERVSPVLDQTGRGTLSSTRVGSRSSESSVVSPSAVPALASSAVTDMNSGGGVATTSGYKVANNGAVTGEAVTGSLGVAGSPLETPASSDSPVSPTASEGSTDPASQNGGAGTASAVRQATAMDLYRARYGWAAHGEMIRRQMIDQYNGTASSEAGSPPLDATSPSSGQ